MSDLEHDLRAALHDEAERAPDAEEVVGSLLAVLRADRHSPVDGADDLVGRPDGADGTGATVVPLHRRRVTRLVAGWGVAAAVVLAVGTVLPAMLDPHEVSTTTQADAPRGAAGGAAPGIADMSPLGDAYGSPVPLPTLPEPRARGPFTTARLALEQGCLVARSGSTNTVVLWAPGTTAVVEDGLVVVRSASGAKIAAVGDEVAVSSTPHPAGNGTTGTSPCQVSPTTPTVDAG